MNKIEFETSKGSFVLIDESELTKIDKIIVSNDNDFIKLSEITDKQASEVVDSFDLFGNINVGYKNYSEEEPVLNTAKESLHSLLKSKGVYLFENPIIHPNDMGIQPASFSWYLEQENQHNEAELKTFYNPYLFKKI